MSLYTDNVRELLFVLEHNDELRHRLIDVLGGPVQRPKLTYEEFLAWPTKIRLRSGLMEMLL